MRLYTACRKIWQLNLIIFSIFFLARIWGLNFGLPFDGIHPTEQFSILNSLHYVATADFKPLNYQHPCLFQYIISILAYILRLPTEQYQLYYMLGRIISSCASLLSLVALYAAGRRLFQSEGFAALCCSFLGVNILSVQYSHYAVPDSLCVMFIVLTILTALGLMEDAKLRKYLICGLMCGLSAGSKFYGVISVVFFACAHAGVFRNKKTGNLKFILGVLTGVAVFFFVTPYHVLNLKDAFADFSHYFDEKGYTGGLKIVSPGLFIYMLNLLPGAFGVIAFLCALAGMGVMFFRRRDKAFFLFVPVLLYIFVIGREKNATLQNMLPLLPVLSIAAVYFFESLKKRGWSKGKIGFIIILCLSPMVTRTLIFDLFILKKDTRVLAQEWLKVNVESKAKIGFEPYTPYDLDRLRPSFSARNFDAAYFVPSLSLYPAGFYAGNDYAYIVTSGFRYDVYGFFCQRFNECACLDNYKSFDSDLDLVAEFAPEWVFTRAGFQLPWGTWPHNPVVKVYKVR